MAEACFDDVLSDIMKAAKVLGLPREKLERLRHPRREVAVSIPVVMDDHAIHVFTGHRIQYFSSRGPFMGGVRFDPAVDLDTLRAQAVIVGLKNAAMEIPWGGAMGGVDCDPERLSPAELERVTRRYTYMLAPVIGPKQDILSPDRGTDERVMGWMMDTYSTLKGHTVAGVVTGKPTSLGGCPAAPKATGRGVMFVVRRALERADTAVDHSTAALLGFGSAGSSAAFHLARKGCRVLAASDLGGGVHDPDGLDVPALVAWAGSHQTVAGFPRAEPVSDREVMGLDVDVLVSAAHEMTITGRNAHLVEAPIVAEAANASVTSAACDALHRRGVVVLPDLLAGAGGQVVSYFEWVQDTSCFFWSEADVNVRMRDLLLKAYDEVAELAAQHGVDLRTAAYVLALSRLVDAQTLRGVWP